MIQPRYELTAHAVAVIAEREIDPVWVERVLANPDRTESDPRDATLVHALARIAERAERVLRVVYNRSANPPCVVTAYFDRRQRDKA